MKVFLVRIGRNTRSGNFQEMYSRAVSVSDDTNSKQVCEYFKPRYQGFDVRVDAVETEDMSETIPKSPRPAMPSDGAFGCISGFKVEYTENEQKLYEDYKDLNKKADEKLRELHHAITRRYEKLPYVSNGGYIEFDTNVWFGVDGTICKKLPIRSSDFFKVVKNGDNGEEKLQIIENTGDSDNDIPF